MLPARWSEPYWVPGRTVVTTTATTSLYSLLQTHCSLSLPRLYGNEKDKMSRHLILRRNGELRALRAMTESLRAIIITFLSSPCRPGGWSQCRHRSEVPAGTTCLHRNSKDTESETRGLHVNQPLAPLWFCYVYQTFVNDKSPAAGKYKTRPWLPDLSDKIKFFVTIH